MVALLLASLSATAAEYPTVPSTTAPHTPMLRAAAPALTGGAPVFTSGYERARRVHIVGNVLAVGGSVLIGPGLVLLVGGALGQSEPLALAGATLFLGSASAALTGGFMSTLGALRASRHAGATSRVPGTVGVVIAGLAAASPLISFAVQDGTPVLVAWSFPIAAAVLGSVQMQIAQRELRAAVLPRPGGMVFVARF